MRILFICTGNMTRSPLAEAVLRKKLTDAGLKAIEVTSAGTGATDGLARDSVMQSLQRFMEDKTTYR